MRDPIPGPKWIPVFLETLVETRIVSDAMTATGKTPGTIYAQRNRNLAFATAWRDALDGKLTAKAARDAQKNLIEVPANGGWKDAFLSALADSSNIKKAAQEANIPVSTVYRERSKNPAFAQSWQAALFEGYTNLEMEVLGHLRDPDPARPMDITNALRLLAAHRDSFAREHAQRQNVTAAEVRASIERKVEKLRQQVAKRKAKEAHDGQ